VRVFLRRTAESDKPMKIINNELNTLEIVAASSDVNPSWPEAFSSLVRLDVAGQTHVGKVRESNEDNFLIARAGRSLQTLMTSLQNKPPQQFDEVGYAMVVADGVGGASAGEIASSSALATLVNLVLQTPDWILRADEHTASEIMKRLQDRFLEVNRVIIAQARKSPRLSGMGTTLTVAWSIGQTLFIGHVGDSRAYLLRRGELHRLTKDQTMVQTLIDAGVLKPGDQVARQFRNVLMQAIGMEGQKLEPEVQTAQLFDGDELLLCSDGLTDMVDDQTIANILGEKETATEACRALVDRALENGGKDNVTVVVARYQLPHQPVEGTQPAGSGRLLP
jgi:PPM family protein phosphatase